MVEPHVTKRTVAAAVFLAALGLALAPVQAADWAQWRGPNHNGSTSETGLPETWDGPSDALWAVDMPGRSDASPVIQGDRVFVVSNDTALNVLYGICIDANTGKVLWQKELVNNASGNPRNTMASCSPVADGERVFFMFGSSDLFALDYDGNEVWSRNLNEDYGAIAPDWGYSSSPLLFKGKLYVPILRGARISESRRAPRTDADSHLVCIDPKTGKDIWRVHRPSDAVGESFDSYATPVPYEGPGGDEIIVAGGDYITGHNAETGKELWRHGNNPDKRMNWRLIPSPVVAGDLIFGVQPRGLDGFAIEPGLKRNMAYNDAKWIIDERTTDVPTPLLYEGRLYVLNGTMQVLRCLDPATGKQYWKGDLESARIWASPTAGDGKIYCIDENGQVIVVQAGEEFKILSRCDMGGGNPSKSSISISGGKLYIRTPEKLFCVAKQ